MRLEPTSEFRAETIAEGTIKFAERFVEQHHWRVADQRPREADAALFAAREFAAALVGERFELDEFEDARDTRGDFARVAEGFHLFHHPAPDGEHPGGRGAKAANDQQQGGQGQGGADARQEFHGGGCRVLQGEHHRGQAKTEDQQEVQLPHGSRLGFLTLRA